MACAKQASREANSLTGCRPSIAMRNGDPIAAYRPLFRRITLLCVLPASTHDPLDISDIRASAMQFRHKTRRGMGLEFEAMAGFSIVTATGNSGDKPHWRSHCSDRLTFGPFDQPSSMRPAAPSDRPDSLDHSEEKGRGQAEQERSIQCLKRTHQKPLRWQCLAGIAVGG